MGGEQPEIEAYLRDGAPVVPVVPAVVARDWMTQTPSRFANRCLPVLLANQSGWFLLNPHTIEVSWSGGPGLGDVAVRYVDVEAGTESIPMSARLAGSHFGHGILTWQVPYIFRTSPGYNLWVRGATNWPKDGIDRKSVV